MIKYIMVLMLGCVGVEAAYAAQERSSAAVRAFKKQTVCPSTGVKSMKCPGYVVDHVIALCAGGPDTPENMQYQTREESYKKDIEERRYCRALKRGATPPG